MAEVTVSLLRTDHREGTTLWERILVSYHPPFRPGRYRWQLDFGLDGKPRG